MGSFVLKLLQEEADDGSGVGASPEPSCISRVIFWCLFERSGEEPDGDYCIMDKSVQPDEFP